MIIKQPSSTVEFAINGKFLLAALEGMPRVGREITAAFDQLLDTRSDIKIEVVAPQGSKDKIQLRNIEITEIGRRQGLLWEQIDLPRYLGDRYCLHFTGTAPVWKRKGSVVVHDAQFISTKKSHSWKSFLLYGLVTPTVARRYTSVITVSQYAKKEIATHGVCLRNDIRVIPNSADHVCRRTSDFSILEKLKVEPQKFLLANSYVHHHKNVRILLEALSSPVLKDCVLVLFGSTGPERYQESGLTVPPNVIFSGRVSDEELVALMKSAKVFLFPSTTEGFGIPPLEAMLLGCPTICASAGAMPEVCGKGALYAEPNNAQEWVSKIKHLWDDPDERHKLSVLGKKRASSYSWIQSASDYLDTICHDLTAVALKA